MNRVFQISLFIVTIIPAFLIATFALVARPDQFITSIFVSAMLASFVLPRNVVPRQRLLVFFSLIWMLLEVLPEIGLQGPNLICIGLLALPALYISASVVLSVYREAPYVLPELVIILLVGEIVYLLPYTLVTPIKHPPLFQGAFCMSEDSSGCPSNGAPFYLYPLMNHYAGSFSVLLVLITALLGKWTLEHSFIKNSAGLPLRYYGFIGIGICGLILVFFLIIRPSFTSNLPSFIEKIRQPVNVPNISEFALPSGFPWSITSGSDGNLWFTEPHSNKIGRITTTGVVTEYPISTRYPAFTQITSGSDGNLWFTESDSDKIGRITTAGVVTEFPISTSYASLGQITSGSDGNLWFTESDSDKIGRITTAGVVTEFPIATSTGDPRSITSGPDGNLWFTEEAISQIGNVTTAGKIGRISTAGVVTEFPLSSSGTIPSLITTGRDGNLWFVEEVFNKGENVPLAGKIGRITIAGTITEFPLLEPMSISCLIWGPDDNLWFTETALNELGDVTSTGKIGRITTAGIKVIDFPIPGNNTDSGCITDGPDGNLWFTEPKANKIGRVMMGS